MLSRLFAAASSLFVFSAFAFGQTLNLYTKPDPGSPGGLAGKTSQSLSHAIALHRDHVSCYRAELSDGGKSFRFAGLPTGKYDLVLITSAGPVYEGVYLGEGADALAGKPRQNLDLRVNKADKFFNKAHLLRFGLTDNGEKLWAFVERLRDQLILKQSGEQLNANLRRFEVIEFSKSADDWTMVNSRHLYREEAPMTPGMPFALHRFLPTLGNIRVIDSVKDLGSIALSAP